MKITALVENTSLSELKSIHGLSLYIETKKHRILFDLGPDMTLFENAKTLNIDLNAVDTVIISHGHGDHGGGLEEFLKVNNTSKVYVQRSAFDEHYSQPFSTRNYIGLNEKLQSNPQVILLDGDYIIDEELRLFTVTDQSKYHSPANDTLYGKDGKDDFSHEQNLIIKEDKVALIMGCGHAGIVNILDKAAEYEPEICVGGYHLFNPSTKQSAPDELLQGIAEEMRKYEGMKYYTCHCTGTEAFDFLANEIPDMFYLSCGSEIEL